MCILSDEIYSRQIFDDKEMPTFFNYPELRDRLIVLEGWSKAYSMTDETRLEFLAREFN